MRIVLACAPDPAAVARARALASALDGAGIAALVLCAARGTGEPRIERVAGLARLVRTDPAPWHWQRSSSAAAARLVRELLAAEQAAALLVVSSRGLAHDLVATAQAAGVPSLVDLADRGLACLVGDRQRRDAPGPCQAPLAPAPCLACAEADPEQGPTPWVPLEARWMRVAERRRDALRELQLARLVLVHDAAEIERARVELGDGLAGVAFHVVGAAFDARELAGLLHTTCADGAPERGPEPGWWVERLRSETERVWDAAWRAAREGA
ncbi:MAG: hypothetical protein JNK02_05625 [Planctomycetes bacterium]|nr:hypothetical protein [Planctomycetota bacterium]